MYDKRGKIDQKRREYSSGDMWIDSKHRLASTLLVTLPALLGNVPSSSFEPYVKAKIKRQWKQSHQQFHQPLQEHRSHRSITHLCSLQPDQFSGPLKWICWWNTTLLVCRCPVSHLTTLTKSDRALGRALVTQSTNTSQCVCVSSIPMTAVLTGCWLDTGCIIESCQ